MHKELTWKIGGEAGFGIMVSGWNFARVCLRGGLHVYETNEYPSIIRGGHNTEIIRASTTPIQGFKKTVDFLVALNRETIDLHKNELTPGAAVMYDPENCKVEEHEFPVEVNLYPVPLFSLAKENGGDILMRNTVAIGASIAVMEYDLSLFNGVITDQFKRKGEEVVNQNILTAKAGYDYIKQHFTNPYRYAIHPVENAPQRILLSGNEALGMGVVAAGMKYFAAYPMTPINGLLHYLSSIQEKAQFIYKQPEDEIAAINMAIGASFAGARSMVASSGGGYALMVEGTSLAGMTEIPIVIVYGMRPGPATGLPTWTGQSDLKFVLNAGHGEFPKIVLAPGDIEEAHLMALQAFNLADKYQTPVFIVTDKLLNESRRDIDPTIFLKHIEDNPIDRGKLLTEQEQLTQEEWNRYTITEDGVSPRPIPGRAKGIFRANSDEHTEDGYSSEDAGVARSMVEKRMRKFEMAKRDVPQPTLYGPKDADITLVGWGSTKGAVLDGLELLKNADTKMTVNYLHLNWIMPFPSKYLTKMLLDAKKVIAVEGAHNAPLCDYLREQTGFNIKYRILKYDGRPFHPEDIVEGINKYI